MQNPPLNWLRSFNEAARLLSFTRAAQELSLTQAAVSKHIKGLESALGVQLFIREAHGLQLTEQGKRFYASCAPLLDRLSDVTQQFAHRAEHSRLRIRSNISYSTLILPSHLMALREQRPGVRVDINNGIWEPDRPSENAHLDIGYTNHESATPSTTLKLLGSDDQLFPVVAAHINDEQLLELPLIQVSGYSGEWLWWLAQPHSTPRRKAYKQWLSQMQQQANAALRTDNSLSAYQLCAQGLGVALARSSMVQTMIATGQLKKIHGARALPAPEVFFARLSERGQHHPAARALFDLL